MFTSLEIDGTGLNESRAAACEIVAWQFLTYLSEKELIDYLLYELPTPNTSTEQTDNDSNGLLRTNKPQSYFQQDDPNEGTALLQDPQTNFSTNQLRPPQRDSVDPSESAQMGAGFPRSTTDADIGVSFQGLNALEIAAVANAKRFLSQPQVQKIVADIWHGDVVFWESLSVHAVKKARTHNKRVADPYSRLRVPKYQKAFQVAFFASFLALYYAVLVERNPRSITATEALLYVWIAAFAYDEFGEFQDAGILFYQTDFWSLWDCGIIGTGAAFLVTSTSSCSYPH